MSSPVTDSKYHINQQHDHQAKLISSTYNRILNLFPPIITYKSDYPQFQSSLNLVGWLPELAPVFVSLEKYQGTDDASQLDAFLENSKKGSKSVWFEKGSHLYLKVLHDEFPEKCELTHLLIVLENSAELIFGTPNQVAEL